MSGTSHASNPQEKDVSDTLSPLSSVALVGPFQNTPQNEFSLSAPSSVSSGFTLRSPSSSPEISELGASYPNEQGSRTDFEEAILSSTISGTSSSPLCQGKSLVASAKSKEKLPEGNENEAQVKKLAEREAEQEAIQHGLEHSKKVGEYKRTRSSSLSTFFLRSNLPVVNAPRVSDRKIVARFLKHVVAGEQGKVEGLLKGSLLKKGQPSLVLEREDIIDLSGREFKNIAGFQYALWALDWHMWRLLLKYLPREEAAAQLAELEEKGTAHGRYFRLEPLIEALHTYESSYDAWYQAYAWKQMADYWCKVVGKNQRLLPAHVVQEYCHPKRTFCPCPDFEDEKLPRYQKCNIGNWFTCEKNGGKLGETFGIIRAFSAYAYADTGAEDLPWTKVAISDDKRALQSLYTMRQRQLEDLKAALLPQNTLSFNKR